MQSKQTKQVTRFFIILIVIFNPFLILAEQWIVKDSVLTIGRYVKCIPSYQFSDRTDIREVKFENGTNLKSIGEYAFLGCSNLKEIELPHTLSSLGEGCFRECGFEELSIPDGVKAIPKAMCSWNKDLRSVKLPSRLVDIGSHAFAYCERLQAIDIPSSVMHIGSNAFSRCKTIKEVKLPPAMKELESYAFSDCESLETAMMPSNANLLGELIFSGCVNLRNLTVMSTTPPPFDCNSFIFEPDETILYNKCKLHVPGQSIAKYRRAPGWKLFNL